MPHKFNNTQTGTFFLYYDDGSHSGPGPTLVPAKDVELYGKSSEVEATLPANLTGRDTYRIGLGSTTADHSGAVTITERH